MQLYGPMVISYSDASTVSCQKFDIFAKAFMEGLDAFKVDFSAHRKWATLGLLYKKHGTDTYHGYNVYTTNY